MLNTAPLTDAAALSAAAWQLARCEPMSGVLRAVLTKAQAAALCGELKEFPVQVCGIPTGSGVTLLFWLPAREFDLLIEIVRRALRYTCSVQKLFAKECPEYPGAIWLTGRCLLRWLTKGTSHHDNLTNVPGELLQDTVGTPVPPSTPLPLRLRAVNDGDQMQRWPGNVSGV